LTPVLESEAGSAQHLHMRRDFPSRFMQIGIAASLLVLLMLLPLIGLASGLLWLPLAFNFVLIPLLDAAVGRMPAGRPMIVLPSPAARWIVRAVVPLQVVLLGVCALAAPQLTLADGLMLALAVGSVTGAGGITIAHELGHRASRLDRALSRLLLVTVGYGHFYVEHNRGHHVRVATAADPASAPRGMAVYPFLFRSIVGSFRHAWRLEAMRLQRRGRSVLHPSNWVLTGTALSLLLLIAAGWMLGMAASGFLLGQAVVAVALLETVNYIEHYGLRRRRLIDGRIEPVGPQHSWNADFIVSNWLLFNLQLHSDHHAHVERPFETLRSIPEAPQLPAGYPTLVLAALVPPLWFALMDRRLPPDPAGAPA
jgi:alkane 1-monooxygenase